MPKQEIITEINRILNADFGFDVYIAMKNDEQLIKKFVLCEARPGEGTGFKTRIRDGILETIRNVYLAESAEYANADAMADD